jgi:hypothetical protein
MSFDLYYVNRQLDLLCVRADRISAGLCRDSLVRRIERLNMIHHLLLAKLAAAGKQS